MISLFVGINVFLENDVVSIDQETLCFTRSIVNSSIALHVSFDVLLIGIVSYYHVMKFLVLEPA